MNVVLSHYRAACRDFVPHFTGPASNIVDAMREFKRLQQACLHCRGIRARRVTPTAFFLTP
jgi:hypothetical protein